ncbi:uncharacterized protein BJX67DRAFT_339659 [Aspergillus lucknowensis]|uniref:Uncharacterized protein n=1 Tax=Aspergillus lucknowensis TaxID=176173 RepID=A0ABR4M7B5_9EURO
MVTPLSDFAFASSETDIQYPTHWQRWPCTPPNACAHDSDIEWVYYCNQNDSRCWSSPIECANDDAS